MCATDIPYISVKIGHSGGIVLYVCLRFYDACYWRDRTSR